VRQLKAQDTGNHAEFIVDPMMGQDDGMLKLDTFIRLRQVFGPVPRLTRIIYNNRLICGGEWDFNVQFYLKRLFNTFVCGIFDSFGSKWQQWCDYCQSAVFKYNEVLTWDHIW